MYKRQRLTLRDAIEAVVVEHELDAMGYPTITQIPVMIGDGQPGTACPLAANSGLPALSVPVGFTNNGLPVGMELMGKHFQDAELLAIAKPFEEANSPRKSPFVTPALVDGAPPANDSLQVRFNRNGVSFMANFEYSIVTNNLSYDLSLMQNNSAEVFAITLIIDTEDIEGLNEAMILNLLGPKTSQASGDYFMTPDFREAFEEERVYFRVFAESMPISGVTQSVH